jgi:signal peptidase I
MVFGLFSRTRRQAKEMCRQVLRLLNAQRDLLAPQAVDAVTHARLELLHAVRARADKPTLHPLMANLEAAANKWLKPYPHPSMRENVEVFLVAVAVAMGIRTFFLQPFKIPTGSMQPTLYGITHEDLRRQPNSAIPKAWARFYNSWVRGVSYYHVVAETDGRLEILDETPQRLFPFVNRQRFRVGGTLHTVWFPPDQLFQAPVNRSGVREGQFFRRGDDIIKLKVTTGDHLFVDRVTYNFRPPKRGEIIVFETRGIVELPQDQFYIKRLVALGGETVHIGNDRHLRINGQRLDQSAPGFEGVYGFDGPPRESRYSGHVNEVISRLNRGPNLARLFHDETRAFNVGPERYLVMGDNTMNSLDSRSWGDFSRTNVIGRSCFVYWPFSSRFGWRAR